MTIRVVGVLLLVLAGLPWLTGAGFGTGFYVTENLIVTAAHVANYGSRVQAVGKGICTVRAMNMALDLALLEVPTRGCPIAFAEEVTVGTPILLYGFESGAKFGLGYASSVFGHVSRVPGVYPYTIQLDMLVRRGLSGGPVVGPHGLLRGMLVSRYTGDDAGLAYAVHVHEIWRWLERYGVKVRTRQSCKSMEEMVVQIYVD